MKLRLSSLLFFLLLNVYFCQSVNKRFGNIYKRFEIINEQILKFNQIAANIAWESSINPGNPKLQRKAANYQREKIQWQHETCATLVELSTRHLLNDTQKRQSYLLCRGPKFTYEEARDTSYFYEELQSLYSDAEICIPSSRTVSNSNLKDAEGAILDYLSIIEKFSLHRNFSMPLVKLTFYGKNNYDTFCLKGEEDFEKLMRFSKNEKVLKWLWVTWRAEVSAPMREIYEDLVTVQNRAAKRNGYSDIGASWRDELEIPELKQLCRDLYSDIRPFYKLLHGVVRFYLRRYYGDIVTENGPIPAHLLGDLWSQNWEALADLIIPNTVDLDKNIKNLNKSIVHLVKRAEDFYQSLGLPPMTREFWRESVFRRKKQNRTRCHGTAADMFKPGDFRLLYCPVTPAEDFYVLHHEMGHIQYFMAYENKPAIFRQGNAALHETIGDTIMYGAMAPQHLNRLGIVNDSFLYADANIDSDNALESDDDIDNYDNKTKTDQGTKERTEDSVKVVENKTKEQTKDNIKVIDNITQEESTTDNHDSKEKIDLTTNDILLLQQALNKIPQIPFSLLIDEYRWKYFEGEIDERLINKEFWDMALDLQGIAPPVNMGEKFFDIGAKFHVPDNTPYIRYFLSSFLQHQLFEVLCKTSVFGRRGSKADLPKTMSMNRCDIYGSKAAGNILKSLMSRGSSQEWRDILLETTGIDEISASALKRYYRPLIKLLKRIVRVNQIPIGW